MSRERNGDGGPGIVEATTATTFHARNVVTIACHARDVPPMASDEPRGPLGAGALE